MIKAVVAFKKAVATIGFKKAIADINFGDFLIFRFFFDVLGITDSPSKVLGRSIGDSSSAFDAEIKGIAKVESDASFTTDSAFLGFGAVQSDAASFSDDIDSFDLGKRLQDSPVTSEDQNMDFHKFISEQTGVTDDLDGEATADDDQEMTFTKVRSNLATMTDLFVSSSGKGLSDTIGSSDSGSLRGQGYCAFDYFEADYVGYIQSF
jgi:hypothetical protein